MASDVLLSNYSHVLGLKVCVVIPGSRAFSYNTKLKHRPRVMFELIHTVCPWLPLLSTVDGLFPCLDSRGWNGLPLSHPPSTGSSLSYLPSLCRILSQLPAHPLQGSSATCPPQGSSSTELFPSFHRVLLPLCSVYLFIPSPCLSPVSLIPAPGPESCISGLSNRPW